MTLSDYIQSKMKTPFKWGVNDCMTFTIGWVEQFTGRKYLPSPIWESEKQALRIVKKEGGLKKVFDKNFKMINPNYAKDGDITICEGAAAIICGRYVITVGVDGIIHRLRSVVDCAWSIK